MLLSLLPAASLLPAQTIYKYEQKDAEILFFNKEISTYIPHIVRMYREGKVLHEQIWEKDSLHRYVPQQTLMLITDWEDDGNGGVCAIPRNIVFIGMSPLNFSYYIAPSTERYSHLFRHEYTHIVMSDKYNSSDMRWRKALGSKFYADPQHPFSAVFSYLSTPRWYAPRWYHEGIACFMETWLGGGVGRALGGYDEMNFRSLVADSSRIYSVVGLETEGTTQDFQVGTNSYLYGTRFVNYLVYKYGVGKLIDYYNRTEGSKTLFNKQFEKIYGVSLRKAWEEWIALERDHQKKNLDKIAEYPVTETDNLSNTPLGSVSPPLLDKNYNCLYAAVNHPDDLAHIARIDLATGKVEKLHVIDGPQLYQTSYLALDTKGQRLIYTVNNSHFRGINIYDIKKKKIVKRLKYQRVSNIVYDNSSSRLYGIFTNGGVNYLIRYDSLLTKKDIIYAFPFGQSIFDIDVSHNGNWLTATVSGLSGEQSIIRFDVNGLGNAQFKYDTLITSKEYNFGQFRFSEDDSCLVGSSYYTGVSNIWSFDIATKEFNLLSNTKTGLFAPYQFSKDSLYALQSGSNGMRPVKLARKVLHDANAIELLGQKTYERNKSDLEKLSEFQKPLPEIKFGDVYNKITTYNTFKEIRFAGAYPEISGFTDSKSTNDVTPVIGYRIAFQDPMGLNSIKASVGISPWSNNPWKNRFHAEIEWDWWQWKFAASWNKTNFYDLFGPLRRSRKGYCISASYNMKYPNRIPFSWEWGASVAAYGEMDALPLFQNVEIDKGIKSIQTAAANISASKLYKSLGAVMPEQGWKAGLYAYTYLADGTFYPSVSANIDGGLLVPFMRNTSVWLRSYFGKSFGDSDSAFGNEYFGGFRNNIVDWQDAYRFRTMNAMPGAKIDAIKAHSFAKIMAELNLTPIRFNNFGAFNLYPTYAQFTLFASDLIANPLAKHDVNYGNIGAQLNIEVVLFKYLKTTWSVGYAKMFSSQHHTSDQWMISLKLL